MNKDDKNAKVEKFLNEQTAMIAVEAAAGILTAGICIVIYVKRVWPFEKLAVFMTVGLLVIYAAALYFSERKLKRELTKKLAEEDKGAG